MLCSSLIFSVVVDFSLGVLSISFPEKKRINLCIVLRLNHTILSFLKICSILYFGPREVENSVGLFMYMYTSTYIYTHKGLFAFFASIIFPKYLKIVVALCTIISI